MDAVFSCGRAEAQKASARIVGALTTAEAGMLFDWARMATAPILEIGSYAGRSTVALGRGAHRGAGVHVYAVDSFVGCPKFPAVTPEHLADTLRTHEVSDWTHVIPCSSRDARDQVPDSLGMIFIDGAHDYASVRYDIETYAPRVVEGGVIVLHDVTPDEPGVVQAVDECLMSSPVWIPVGRTDSAMIFRRHASERRKVFLALPGATWFFDGLRAVTEASQRHDVSLHNNGNGWDDFNVLWASALNAYQAGEATHFVMLHSDIIPAARWIDLLVAEMELHRLDALSVVAPIKDRRGVTSCGIGDVRDRWSAFRRWTMREIMELPLTFGLADTPYRGDPRKYLLHNTGCLICDLRCPAFHAVDADGALRCWFDFPTRVVRGPDGRYASARESEDWFFSRKLAEAGARTMITRTIALHHRGAMDFPNNEPWGLYHVDHDTRLRWEADACTPC